MDSQSKSSFKKAVRDKGLDALTEGKDYIIVYNGPKEKDIPPPDEDGFDAYSFDRGYIGYVPLHYEASKVIASSRVGSCVGQWCTAYQKDSGYWDDHVVANDETLVYFVYYPNEKEQHHPESWAWKYAGVYNPKYQEFSEYYDSKDRDDVEGPFSKDVVDDIILPRMPDVAKLVDRIPGEIRWSLEEFKGKQLGVVVDTVEEDGKEVHYIDSRLVIIRAAGFKGFSEDIRLRNVERLEIAKVAQYEPGRWISEAHVKKLSIYKSGLPTTNVKDYLPKHVYHLELESVKLQNLKFLSEAYEYISRIDINHADIETLIGIPRVDVFHMDQCLSLTTLTGLPEKMHEVFIADTPTITSLKGSPKEVATFRFQCVYNNRLASLEGGPEIVHQSYTIYTTEVRSLKGFPKVIGTEDSGITQSLAMGSYATSSASVETFNEDDVIFDVARRKYKLDVQTTNPDELRLTSNLKKVVKVVPLQTESTAE
jgi:hypothetical protein